MIPEFDWPVRLAAAALAAGLLTLYVVRALRKDRREYARFRRYRSTARRQRMMRRWLLESLLLFGGSAAVVLVLVWPVVQPLLHAAQAVPPIAWLRDALGHGLGLELVIGLVIGGVVALAVFTVLGIRSARREGGVVMLGDIAAMLPRNRPELGWGAALSINAGVVEEALFRLAMPALLVIVTGEPLSAFALAALVFGALHAYQGWVGVLTTTIVGLLFTTLYVLSGSIGLAMLVHAVFNLRTLVLIPMTVYRVHRVPGSVAFPAPLGAPGKRAQTAPLGAPPPPAQDDAAATSSEA